MCIILFEMFNSFYWLHLNLDRISPLTVQILPLDFQWVIFKYQQNHILVVHLQYMSNQRWHRSRRQVHWLSLAIPQLRLDEEKFFLQRPPSGYFLMIE